MSYAIATTRTTLAQKTALATEARRRFELAMSQLKQQGRAADRSGDLVGQCNHLLTRIDVIQSYTRCIEDIFHGSHA